MITKSKMYAFKKAGTETYTSTCLKMEDLLLMQGCKAERGEWGKRVRTGRRVVSYIWAERGKEFES